MYYRLVHRLAKLLHGLFAVSLILKFSEVPLVSWPMVFSLLCASVSVELLDYTFARMTVRRSEGDEGIERAEVKSSGSRWVFHTHDNLLCAAYVAWTLAQSAVTARLLASKPNSWSLVFGLWVSSLALNTAWHVADIRSSRRERFRRRVEQRMGQRE